MIEIKRILCPIDFSDYSRHALDHAVVMARSYDSTITLLHVYSSVPVAAYAPGTPMHPSVALTAVDREEILTSMKRFAEDEAGSDRPIQCETCEGSAAAEILARANAMPSDLIVMGTHGRSGFERLVLGSVTEKVLRKAECPVLSVPRHVRDAVPAPPVSELLDVDREYREKVFAGQLQLIAPRRFNPAGEAWLPILHTGRGTRHYTALYSNTARAHGAGKTRDWVVLYHDDGSGERLHTVVTAARGSMRGRRVVAGREPECVAFYLHQAA